MLSKPLCEVCTHYVVEHAAHCLSVLVVSNVEPSLVHLLTVDQLLQQLLHVPVTSDHADFVCCHSDVSIFSIAVLFLAATDSGAQKPAPPHQSCYPQLHAESSARLPSFWRWLSSRYQCCMVELLADPSGLSGDGTLLRLGIVVTFAVLMLLAFAFAARSEFVL